MVETLYCSAQGHQYASDQSVLGFSAVLLERLKKIGQKQEFEPLAPLYERGQRGVDMFVVLSGEIEVFESDGLNRRRTVAVLHEGQFTGELDLLDTRESLLGCRAVSYCRLLRIGRPALQQLMRSDPEVANHIMHACVARHFDIVRHAAGGVVIVGNSQSADTMRLQRFLIRNECPYRLVAADCDGEAGSIVTALSFSSEQLPLALLPGNRILSNPSNACLAEELGLNHGSDAQKVYDVAIVGAGPAGLGAAVYAASEGLATVVIEGTAPGGQAGTSSHIENYLGFPTGISGQDLSQRSQVQAQKFGAHFIIARSVVRIEGVEGEYSIVLEGGQIVRSRTVVIATGAKYRRLQLPNYTRFEYQGIHYAATSMEAALCKDEEVVVVGGGNSAGQAALFLSQSAKHVYLLSRRSTLKSTMSDYLVQRALGAQNISVCLDTEVTGMDGDEQLQKIRWLKRGSGASVSRPIRNMFVMIGADPNTDWLRGTLATDEGGFIITGNGAGSRSLFGTTLEGVYAVGDVRRGSTKRVASAVGEGSCVVSEIHRYLETLDRQSSLRSAEIPPMRDFGPVPAGAARY